MSVEDLPRMLYDPQSGRHAMEFRRLNGVMPSTMDRMTILGCFESDVVQGTEDKPEVTHRNVGFLDVLGTTIPTDHGYNELRDLLYPAIKENQW